MSFKKHILAALAVSCSLLASQAQATPWIYTASGIISGGYDSGNYFSGGNMTGKSFSITYTVDPTLYANQTFNGTMRQAHGTNSGPVSELITIDGITKLFNLDMTKANDGQSTLLWDAGSSWGYVQQYQLGYLADGTVLEGTENIYPGIHPTFSFDQSLSYTLTATDTPYGNIRVGATMLSTQIRSVSINALAQGSTVPEPTSLALLGLGFAGLMSSRRKAKQA